MSFVTIELCPICRSDDIKEVISLVDYFSTGESFPICDCNNCGFRFTSYFPSEDTIAKYYDSPEYISHSNTDKGIINKLYHLVRRIMLKRKVGLVLRHTKREPARLLDIGCGTGHFLNAAKEQGIIVSGIEKDRKAREFARNTFDLEVNDTDNLQKLDKQIFDVVTLWHVLEHLEKLNESVENIKEILVPDGTVIIALPNHNSYDASHYKKFWAAYDVPRHLWHFTPITIRELLTKHGFKVVEQKRMPLDAFYISLLSEKYKGNANFFGYIKACLIGGISVINSFFAPTKSSSLVYIAKRKND